MGEDSSSSGRWRAVAAGVIVAVGIAAALTLVSRHGASSSGAGQGTAGQSAGGGIGSGGPSGAAGGPGAHGPGVSPGASGSTPTRGAASSGQAGATSSTSANWFSVTLGSTCVTPGGTQSLTAHSRPGYTVAFNSRYPDGKTGDTYGGFGIIPTDSNGVATSHWTIKATAPLGTVTLSAGTANGGAATRLTRTFTIAAHC